VNIGFDPGYTYGQIPVPGAIGVQALVDTVATDSCVDSLFASQLNLPIVDKPPISGIRGAHVANVHLAQVRVPLLNVTIYGAFTAVDLTAGGQVHRALIGRTFLRNITMVYEGRTGTVTITSD
jgi:hypothetical protein